MNFLYILRFKIVRLQNTYNYITRGRKGGGTNIFHNAESHWVTVCEMIYRLFILFFLRRKKMQSNVEIVNRLACRIDPQSPTNYYRKAVAGRCDDSVDSPETKSFHTLSSNAFIYSFYI